MEMVTLSVKVLNELIKIADDFIADPYASDISKSYFIGKRDAYKNIIDTFAN